MDDNNRASPQGVPKYEDLLPVSWEALEPAPSPNHIMRLHETNEDVLKTYLLLDEHQVEGSEEHHALAQQITILDAKLNLVLDMVGQVLSGTMSIPEPVPISLTAVDMQWTDITAPESNAYIHVNLYLKPNYPQPIILPALVKSVTQVTHGYNIDVVFQDLGDTVVQWLEKIVFRHHRRKIALSRHK